jgi:hypothetical protein
MKQTGATKLKGNPVDLKGRGDNGDTYISLCGCGNGRWLAFQKSSM